MNTTFNFRNYIENHVPNGTKLEIKDENHYQLVNNYGLAEINFWPEDIVEIKITAKKDEETKYYLHFQQKDRDHTIKLYEEMVEALASVKNHHELKVLLSCSSGFTTSYFAEKLNEAAKALDLSYSFSAVSYYDIYEHVQNYDVVLIAPQIGYMLKRLQASLPKTPVFQIPTAAFAAYDPMAMIEFLQSSLKKYFEDKKKEKEADKKTCSGCIDKKKILTLAERYDGNEDFLYTRVYQNGNIIFNEVVIKPDFHAISLSDTIDYVLTKVGKIDMIGLATPGEVSEDQYIQFPQRGYTHYNFKKVLEEKYGVPVYLMNNVNAAVLGYHASHPEYQNISYISQPFARAFGGQGNIVNGALVMGLNGIAGESKYYLPRLQFSDSIRNLAKTDYGQLEIMVNTIVPIIAILGPEVIVIRNGLVTDMHELRKRLMSFIPENNLPKLVSISSSRDFILEGILNYCISKKQKKKETTSSPH